MLVQEGKAPKIPKLEKILDDDSDEETPDQELQIPAHKVGCASKNAPQKTTPQRAAPHESAVCMSPASSPCVACALVACSLVVGWLA